MKDQNQMPKAPPTEDRLIEVMAKAIYYANLKELPDGKLPPIWENISDAVRAWVRNQARDALIAYGQEMIAYNLGIEQPGSLNPSARSGLRQVADNPGS